MVEAKIDPVKYEIFCQRLSEILAEGKEVTRFLASSTIAREAGEVITIYCLNDGEAVLISSGILMHILNATRVIRYALDNRYPEDPGVGIYEGDMFINNDPWVGGIHPPDMALVTPFYYQGKQLGYLAALCHTNEVGGIEPGGMPPSATEAFHDGIHLPVVKLVERGHMQNDVYNMILRATRDPRGMELDMKARIAGIQRMEKRLKTMIDDVGADFFEQATHRLVDEVEAIARNRFKTFRPGIYRERIFNDTVSPGLDKIAVIEVELEFNGEGELKVRLPVVSPQARGFNNTYITGTEASLFVGLLVMLFYDIRWNTALTRAVTLECPANTRLSADLSYSVVLSPIGALYMFLNPFVLATSRALYIAGKEEDVMAGLHGRSTACWAGTDPFGRKFSNILGNMGWSSGGGARIGRDGIDSSVSFHTPTCFVTDQEGEEALAPLLRLLAKQAPDSGGFGKWRGGVSTEGINIIHNSKDVVNFITGTGKAIQQVQSLFGGYPPAAILSDRLVDTNFYEQVAKDAEIEYDVIRIRDSFSGEYMALPGTTPTRVGRPGDMQIWRSGAGAGLGDPLERDPALIVKDLVDRVATLELSQKIYAVEINPQTLEVDHKATEKKRQQIRAERLRRGMPGRDYLKQLVQRRENRELPPPCLAWLDETISFSEIFQKELEAEKMLSGKTETSLNVGQLKGVRYQLTPYVNIVDTEQGNVAVCSQCNHVYGPVAENFKYHCLIYERNPEEIHPPERRMAPNKEWCIYREFYCPGCGTQVEVEVCPHGAPIWVNYRDLK